MAKKVEEKPAIPHFLAGSGDVMSAVSAYAAAMGQRLSRTLLDYGYRLNRSLNVDGQDAMEGPLTLQPVAGANLPTPSAHPGALVFDTTAQRPAYSDGSAWRWTGGLPGISVTDLGAVGDDSTDCTTEVAAAVAWAYANGVWLYWPPGTYVTSASIPNLHAVRHFGPGVLKRGANMFNVVPLPGVVSKVYVSPSGSDSNDGVSSGFPKQTLQNAVDVLRNYYPNLSGSWEIVLAAGSYAGGVTVPRNTDGQTFLKFKGPAVGGHPNVPTAKIEKALSGSDAFGITSTDGSIVQIDDVQFEGPFAWAVLSARHTYTFFNNVHIDGQRVTAPGQGVVGFQVNSQAHYRWEGGLIKNCTEGIKELFGVTRDFPELVSSLSGGAVAADYQLVIEDCDVGLNAKENCRGHTDLITFRRCGTGMELQAWSTTNPRFTTFEACGVGIHLTNSEVHNEPAIIWGTGANACTRRILSVGNSSELSLLGHDGTNTYRTGHRPLITIADDYAGVSHTGTVSETVVFSPGTVLIGDYYCTKGKRFRVEVYGEVASGPTAGTITFHLRVATAPAVSVTVPSGASAGPFHLKFEVQCYADGDFQQTQAVLVGQGYQDVALAPRTITLSDADHSLTVGCTLANAADSVDFTSFVVWG